MTDLLTAFLTLIALGGAVACLGIALYDRVVEKGWRVPFRAG